jgi:cyclophilin family peptidyl-prolyl cis-trans isomerase
VATENVGMRRRGSQIALVVIVIVIAVLLYNRLFGGGNGDDSTSTNGNGERSAPVNDEVTTTFADPSHPVEPTCPAEDGSSPRAVQFTAPPPMCIDPSVTYVATVTTTRGFFEITLDAGSAPLAVNNFIFLARWHYYEGVGFHRIIPDFVVQTGDPIGPIGYGNPGYTFADELPSSGPPFYPLMSLAMANSGPDTNGSQFFIVIGARGEQLPAKYTRFGSVTAGVPVVEDIAGTADPDAPKGEPKPDDLTVIESITVR